MKGSSYVSDSTDTLQGKPHLLSNTNSYRTQAVTRKNTANTMLDDGTPDVKLINKVPSFYTSGQFPNENLNGDNDDICIHHEMNESETQSGSKTGSEDKSELRRALE